MSSPKTQSGLSFDAASIKLVKSGTFPGGVRFLPGGRLHAPGTSVKNLILAAYRTQYDQLDNGGNPWIENERYDVEATAGREVPLEDVRSMLQTLLAERLKLKVHREMRPTKVYELAPASGGLKLTPPKEDGCKGTDGFEAMTAAGPFVPPCGSIVVHSGVPGYFAGGNVLISDLIEMMRLSLSNTIDRIVLDKTGYTGRLDLHLEFVSTNLPASENPGYPTIFNALPEQLGIQLRAATDPIEFIVVDHAEKPPEPH